MTIEEMVDKGDTVRISTNEGTYTLFFAQIYCLYWRPHRKYSRAICIYNSTSFGDIWQWMTESIEQDEKSAMALTK